MSTSPKPGRRDTDEMSVSLTPRPLVSELLVEVRVLVVSTLNLCPDRLIKRCRCSTQNIHLGLTVTTVYLIKVLYRLYFGWIYHSIKSEPTQSLTFVPRMVLPPPPTGSRTSTWVENERGSGSTPKS